jgi:putative DNA primase/helicase
MAGCAGSSEGRRVSKTTTVVELQVPPGNRQGSRGSGRSKPPAGPALGGGGGPPYDAAKDPMSAAEAFRQQFRVRDQDGLWSVNGQLYAWAGSHYRQLAEGELSARLYKFLREQRFLPTKRMVENVSHALSGISFVPPQSSPSWLPGHAGTDPRELVVVRNGLLRVADRKLLPADPGLFVTSCRPMDYSPDAPSPVTWLAFLHSLWGDDAEAIACWQEYMALAALTSDTSFQKALLLVGPPRSGKGTLLRVLTELAGREAVSSPTLASLGQDFGLWSVIDKQVILLSDTRLGNKSNFAAIAEALLRIIGEDSVNVPRKNISDWVGRLPGRIVLASNELPALLDASGALANRFVVLRMVRSFLGREDPGLTDRLLAELPGIMNWALAGLDRLRARGRLHQPASGCDLLEAMGELASPISLFIRDCLVVEDDAWVSKAALFDRWGEWCREHGHGRAGSDSMFSKQLRAALPQIESWRPPATKSPERPRSFLNIRLRTFADSEGHDDD